ncbi:hypothetical protein ACVWWK_003083 [Bradyrhizobium sp. LB9.1b]
MKREFVAYYRVSTPKPGRSGLALSRELDRSLALLKMISSVRQALAS